MAAILPARGWPAGCGAPALAAGDAVHLVGIGGAGMQALAVVLLARGLRVSGSDRDASPALARLAEAGATVHAGHDAGHVPADARVLVVTAALPAGNPEVDAAREAGIPVVKGKQLLGALVDAGRGIGVAGTHGKTTTTGLVGHILRSAGLDATVFVGGDIPDIGGSAVAGTSDLVVYEADEYDRSFLFGRPHIAVVTNIEHDHPDIYPQFDDVLEAFRAFVALVHSDGRVIVSAGSDAIGAVVGAASATVESYAVRPAGADDASFAADAPPTAVAADAPGPAAPWTARWTARIVGVQPDRQLFDVTCDGACLGTFTTRLPGTHNVGNALAAIAAARALDVDADAIRAAVAGYRGAGRRFEVIADVAGVTVVDDYAHHPTEIAATLSAARSRFPGRRIWAIFQPHTFSRVALLADAFAATLSAADRVVLTPVYGARETAGDGGPDAIDAALRAMNRSDDVHAGTSRVDSLTQAADVVAAEARPGDVALFMGAGDIPRASRAAVRAMARRAAAAVADAARAAGLGGDLLGSSPLSDYTTLRIGGPADVAVRIRTLADLTDWWLLSWRLGAPVRVLGRGSNVLVADAGLPGVALINRCEGWHVVADDGGCERGATDGPPPGDAAATARVVAEGGVTLAALAHQLARLGWAGIEPGVGIPGSVGAAVVTNAGAHGWAMADSVVWAEVVVSSGAVERWDAGRLAFGYRSSALKHDPSRLVRRAVLAVRRDDPTAILTRIAAHSAYRRRTQPTTPSVGSVFQNPPGDFAGRLIEDAGLKGHGEGGARISHVHANFFVNEGGAHARDVRRLIAAARSAVARRAGIRLDLEIETLGDDDEALV